MDLGHAELGVLAEEETSSSDCQVVLTPVPQGLQMLVVDGKERICAGTKRKTNRELQTCHKLQMNIICLLEMKLPEGPWVRSGSCFSHTKSIYAKGDLKQT